MRNESNLYPAVFLAKKYCSTSCSRKALSSSKLGDKNPAKSQKVREQISKTLKKKYESGEIQAYMLNEDQRRENSERMLGERNPNYQGRAAEKIRETWNQLSEKERKARNTKISKRRKGKTNVCRETHPEWYIHVLERARDPERRKKIRLARLAQLEEQCRVNDQTFTPSFNRRAILFFERLDRRLQTTGVYALNPAEYRTTAGYFLDYVNFEKKLIVEWDEKNHYRKDGSLRKRDAERQLEIEAEFPDFRFLRIKEVEESEFDIELAKIF